MRFLLAVVWVATWLATMSLFEDANLPRLGMSRASSAADGEDGDELLFPDEHRSSRSALRSIERLFDARSFVTLLHEQIVELHPSLEGVDASEFDARALAAIRRRLDEEPAHWTAAAVQSSEIGTGAEARSFFSLSRAWLPRGAGPGEPKYAARLDLLEEGLLDALDDPFTQVVRGGELLNGVLFELLQIPSDVGLLAQTDPDGGASIAVVLRDTDASVKGIRRGDRLLGIDGRGVYHVPRRELQRRIARPCRLTLAREGYAVPFEIDVAGVSLGATSSLGAFAAPGVGYVTFPFFRQGVFAELQYVLRRLEALGATSYVVDLRGNPGGLVSEASAVASLFLPAGESIVTLQSRQLDLPELHSTGAGWPDAPLALLVDGNSASASEVVAAALRDHGRAILVGSTTFGKGVGQTPFSMPMVGTGESGTSARIDVAMVTTMALRSPRGRDWHHAGLAPDLRASVEPESRERILFRAELLARPALLTALAEVELDEDAIARLRAASGGLPASAASVAESAGLPARTADEIEALRDVMRHVQKGTHTELAACPELDPALRKAIAALRLAQKQRDR